MRYLLPKMRWLLAMSLTAATCTSFAHEGDIPKGLFKSPPTEHQGLTVTGKDALELGAQIPALDGYKVQVRTVTMKPGGIAKNHDHKTRPGAYYVVEGKVTDVSGTKKRVIHEGEAVLEDKDTEHWVINHTKKEAKLFVFDIVPVKK